MPGAQGDQLTTIDMQGDDIHAFEVNTSGSSIASKEDRSGNFIVSCLSKRRRLLPSNAYQIRTTM